MKIRLKSSMAGYRPDGKAFVAEQGDVIEWDDAEAKRMIEGGRAEEVKEPKGKKDK